MATVRGKINNRTLATHAVWFSLSSIHTTMSVPGIHEYTQREVYTSSRQAALNNKRPIIGKVSSFFHRRSVASTESAMHYSTFNDSFDNGDIKSRKFDEMLFNNQDADASENVDVAFEQLMVSTLI
jgi:hypothetical protein